jgi:photosystem II stability/assembly factor-like uncharacterized protein
MNMADTLWVGTRKGLFRLERKGKSWNIAHVSFMGEPVSMMLHDPRDKAVYAALRLGHFGVKTHRSDDNGKTWTEVATPAYPKSDEPKPPATSMIWALEPAGPKVGDGLWAGTLPGGLFFSGDRGASWTLNKALWERPERKQWMGGGADEPGLHSVCVDPRDPKHVLVAVSSGGVVRTRDGGATWTTTSKGMFAEYMPPEQRENPDVQDVHRLMQCPGNPDLMWVQHHNGIFRSVDHGATWQHVTGMRPSSFGFGVAVHPKDGNTAWFVPAAKDMMRVPTDAKLVVSRTEDGGKTCEVFTEGLPQEHCYDIFYRHALEVDESGKRLAMGSTTGHLFTSSDAGESWKQLPHFLPPIYAVRFGV